MRKDRIIYFVVILGLLGFGTGSAQAGAKLKIDDESKIDLGFRLQTLFINTEKDIDGDNVFDSVNDFKVRRARIRLKGDVTEKMSMFIQTEFSEESGTSAADMRIIDAFMTLKLSNWHQIVTGELMAPVLRQNLTSSGALLAIDRPGIVYKTLTWGARATAAFTNQGLSATDPGLKGKVDVRDMGVTLFGSGSLGGNMSLKYYAGIYDGVQEADPSTSPTAGNKTDSERYSARIQLNFGDPEPGYFNSSTYLGKKKTIGVGVAYDTQADVYADTTTGQRGDYTLYTADGFFDRPIGGGTLTVEGAYIKLDLDEATIETAPLPAVATLDTRQTAGDGFYVQAGYLMGNWQPWAAFETWGSDAANNFGSFDALKLGATYFLKGHNANVKAGYEILNADWNITGTEDKINTFVVGLYVTY